MLSRSPEVARVSVALGGSDPVSADVIGAGSNAFNLDLPTNKRGVELGGVDDPDLALGRRQNQIPGTLNQLPRQAFAHTAQFTQPPVASCQ